MENENSKTVRIVDLVEGDRVRFSDGCDDTVYTINKIHKPGHGDCYVEIGYPDGGRYRTAEAESRQVERLERGAQS